VSLAVPSATPAASLGWPETIERLTAGGGAKGVVEGIARTAIEPVVAAIASGVSAFWKQRVDRDALELATAKARREAAGWPDFGGGALAQ
jgi:hypothetical protein